VKISGPQMVGDQKKFGNRCYSLYHEHECWKGDHGQGHNEGGTIARALKH